MLAEALVAAGHRVTWWVSGFNHRTKQHRVRTPTTIEVSERFSIRIVPTHAYERNISLARIRAEREYSNGVLRLSGRLPPPDVVMVSEPALFYGGAALALQRHWRAALILDTLDLWPEMFHIALPGLLQRFGRLIFAPLYARRARTFRRADGVIAASRDYRAVSMRLAPHLPDHLMQTVYFGVHVDEFRAAMRLEGPLPSELCIPREPGEVRCVFASTLGSNYDVDTIIDAAALMTERGVSFRLYIAGTGPLEEAIRQRLKRESLTRVHFLGNPSASEMSRIYARCDVGIAGYVAGSHVTMPIKGFHYCAAGLAVVTSLAGEYTDLLTESGAGTRYQPGDAAALAGAVEAYVNDHDLLHTARAASHVLGTKFDAHMQYARLVQLVERAVRVKHPTDSNG